MSAQKMLVVSLAKTKGVLGAATRTASGVPAITDLVGSSGLLMHFQDPESSMIVPAEELEVKEVDYNDDVFRAPLLHTIDESGTVTAPPLKVTTISNSNIAVTVTVTPTTVASDKTVLVVIDPGPTHAPLTFVGKTALNAAATVVPVSGVPPGDHVVLASVDGHTTLLDVATFN